MIEALRNDLKSLEIDQKKDIEGLFLRKLSS